MFSSMLSKYSPKRLLATYLSKSLADFFCVDPERVEANLVHDAKVVLKDIEIKEKRLGGLLVSGSVGEIEFSWTWDTSSLITDATLTIKGVSIHVTIIEGNHEIAMIKTETPPSAHTSGEEDAAMNSDWKAKYLQQIIDHLTLVIADVNIAIHLDEGSQVILQAKDIEIQTLKSVERDDAQSALLQKISLASIESWIEEKNASKYPILEPFGYHATVQRISGRRFLDGILSGLFVQGKSWNDVDSSHASSTIRVHAGIRQISGLNRLQQVLLLVGSQETTTNEPSERRLDSEKEGDKAPSSATEIKSIFLFPFQSMEVVLENDTNLRLAGCAIRYCTDGTELTLDCTGGIWMDDVPVSQNNRLIVDFVSSELRLDSLPLVSSSDRQESDDGEAFYNAQSSMCNEQGTNLAQPMEEVFLFDLSVEMLQKLYVGIHAISPQCEEAMAIVEQAMERQSQNLPSSSSLSPPCWIIRSNGIASFRRITGDSDTWVRVFANSPKLTQGDPGTNTPFSFHCLCAS
jgi:hypothetical protein